MNTFMNHLKSKSAFSQYIRIKLRHQKYKKLNTLYSIPFNTIIYKKDIIKKNCGYFLYIMY